MHVVRYRHEHKDAWNAAVRASKNGTFLFLRDYLEYHGARIEDHSLLVFEGATLVAVLPGHQHGHAYVSHGGITHGGFVIDQAMKLSTVLEMFDVVGAYLVEAGFTSWTYKTVPSIYHHVPAEEDRLALFLVNAQLSRRAMLSVIAPRACPPFQDRRQRRVRRSTQTGATVRESSDFEQFWHILTERLHKGFNATPVHSLAEITQLQHRFPANIRLFGAFQQESMTAGVVIYESDRVARTQYIAASDDGRAAGSLDLLLAALVREVFVDKPFVEFGTSDECDGRVLNRGLIEYKEGFGGRSVTHDHYQVDLRAGVQCQLALSSRRGADG